MAQAVFETLFQMVRSRRILDEGHAQAAGDWGGRVEVVGRAEVDDTECGVEERVVRRTRRR